MLTPVTPVIPSPVFSAIKDANNVVTFLNAGSTIATSPVGGGFTFTSNGVYAGSVTISSTVTVTVTGVEVPTGLTLNIYSLSARGMTFTGSGTIALTDQVSVAASTLNGIDALTTGVLSASIVGTVGSATDVKAALTSSGISLSPSILAIVDDVSASVADLNVIDGRTTGTVIANASGTAASLDVLAPASTNNAYTLTVTDVGPVAATVLTSLDAKTTVAVNASSVLTISGTPRLQALRAQPVSLKLSASVQLERRIHSLRYQYHRCGKPDWQYQLHRYERGSGFKFFGCEPCTHHHWR